MSRLDFLCRDTVWQFRVRDTTLVSRHGLGLPGVTTQLWCRDRDGRVGESQVWWDWAKVSRDLKTMTWGEFHKLFMGKYFPATARHAKAQEFLELRQGTMTVLEYVAKFTKLARFVDDYMATDMAKVKRFENGLKLSIRGKIVGLRLQDMDSMVGVALTIEREIEDAWSIRGAGVSAKRRESQSSSSSGKKPRASSSRGFRSCGHQGQGQVRAPSQAGQAICYFYHHPEHMRWDCPLEAGIPRFRDSVVVDRPKHIHKFITLLPKDYCLIPGNGAIKLVDRDQMTYTQVFNSITQGLLIIPRQQCHKTC